MQRAPALGLQAPRTLLSIDPKAQGLSRQGTPQAVANPSVCCILACCSTACTERCEPGRRAACAVPAAGGASSPPSSPRLPRAQGITQYLMVALDLSAPGLSVAVELLRGCRERGKLCLLLRLVPLQHPAAPGDHSQGTPCPKMWVWGRWGSCRSLPGCWSSIDGSSRRCRDLAQGWTDKRTP